MVKGMNGLQGPPYCGTGCFHRRKALYGVPPIADQYNNSKDVREIRNYAEGKHSNIGCFNCMSNCVITTCSIHFTLRRTNSLVGFFIVQSVE